MPPTTSPVNIIDPRKLTDGFPWIVLENNTSLIAKLIDFKSNIPGIDQYDHAMLSIDPGKFVAENMTLFNAYKAVPMERYMVKGGRLAFVQLVNNNPQFTTAFRASVQNRLARPGWQNCYDFLGILGQAINCPWIHTPGLEYCSVDVIRHLVNACPMLPKADQQVINNIPRETNPEKLWQIILQNAQTFSVYGFWDARTGIVA